MPESSNSRPSSTTDQRQFQATELSARGAVVKVVSIAMDAKTRHEIARGLKLGVRAAESR